MTFKNLTLAALVIGSFLLSGCSAMHTAIKKKDLEVKTQMSDTIWLDPVGGNQRTVFLQLKNTSDKDLDIEQKLIGHLQAKGFSVVNNPSQAHYWMQMNVLKADKMDLREANSFLASGYGAALTGAAIGAASTGYGFNSSGAGVAGGIIGGIVGIAADALVEDVNYTVVTDLQISENVSGNVNTHSTGALKQGNAGTNNVSYSKKDSRMRYQTRVISSANKVNLDFAEAKPVLEDSLAKAVSGIL